MCEGGIKAKFEQNPDLKKKLLSTKGKTLVECCTDYIWGTGIPISDEQALHQERWANQGILGEMLQELRDDYIEYEESQRRTHASELHTSGDMEDSEDLANIANQSE